MGIKRKEIIGLIFLQLFFLPLFAQDCNHKSISNAPKEMTTGRFEPSGRNNTGHPYSIFNKVDYQIRNAEEIENYLEEIRNKIIQSGPYSGIGGLYVSTR